MQKDNKKEKRELKHSQNFLYKKDIIQKIIFISNLTKDDFIIEIGAGKGSITKELIKKCNHIIAIEKDKELFCLLKEKFKSYSNIEIINEDFLLYKLPQKTNYKIFSNIPFNITTDILNKIIQQNNKPTHLYLIMQKEAAKRFMGSPYTYETLKSNICKIYYNMEVIYEFRKKDFTPIPSVDCVLVLFIQKESLNNIQKEELKDFISYLYFAKGNTLKEKLKNIFTYKQLKIINQSIPLEKRIAKVEYTECERLFKIVQDKLNNNKKSIFEGSYKKYFKKQSKLEKQYQSRKKTKA